MPDDNSLRDGEQRRRLTLGIDIGSSATKAVLVDVARGVVASASRATALSAPSPGWAEADPSQWWSNVRQLVPELLEQATVEPDDVVALACSGMVPAVVLVDGDANPLAPAMLQNDARAADEVAEMRLQLAGVDVLARTGSALTQQSVAPTVRWLQRHRPKVWAATRRIVGSYDWLAMRLGARPHVERNWALESGLFDFDDRPLAEVWNCVNLDADRVPRVAVPGQVVGALSDRAAAEIGLRTGVPIVVGGADHVLSAYGAGLSEPGSWLIKLGGAGDILAVSPERVLDPRLYLDAHPEDGKWLPNGCMATSGSLLRWLQGILDDPDLTELDDEAEKAPAAQLICLPYFLGEKSPLHDPDLRGAFIGLHLGTTRGDLHRSCLEAIAYGFRQHMEILAENGIALRDPYVTNGGSTSVLWKQILADVLQRPMIPVIGHPGASLGAAVAAAVGVGAATWDSVRTMVRTGDPIPPDPSRRAAYEAGYRLYRELEPALRPLSHELAARARSHD